MIKHHKIIIAPLLFIFFFSSNLILSTEGFSMPKSEEAGTQANSVSGTVLESMDASGYTYMRVNTGSDTIWVAIPVSQVKKGDKVSFYQGMVMPDFHSKTLDRTFKEIVFSAGLVGQGGGNPHAGLSTSIPTKKAGDDSFADAVKAETGAVTSTTQIPQVSGGSAGAVAPFSKTKVEKAKGDNSYTVGEIFAKAKELNGKKVRVAGRVVKYNPNIMGKNWVHLQDGTGDPATNTHDLVVTTKDKVPGQGIVTMEGTMVADKDFGAGYRYVVIVEEGKIVE